MAQINRSLFASFSSEKEALPYFLLYSGRWEDRKMYKTICLMKRRRDLTMAQFMDHYENVHSKIGERMMAGRASHYIRRYLRPITFPMPNDTKAAEPPYDVIMEMWYESEEAFRRATQALTPENLAELTADENNLFDRANMHIFHVEEHASVMPSLT
jgi:EthD domain